MDSRQIKETKFWEKFAGNYDSFIKNTVSKTYGIILEKITAELRTDQTMLEIGTGTGILSFALCTKVSSITASDISPEMIRIARQKQKDLGIGNIDFQIQDCYSLKIPDGSFDVVIASNLLHLLYEPEKPVKEAGRILKPGGIFIAPTFCVGENLKSRIIASVAGTLSGFRIVNKWSVDGLKAFLQDNGFTIIKDEKIDCRFPLAYLVMKKA